MEDNNENDNMDYDRRVNIYYPGKVIVLYQGKLSGGGKGKGKDGNVRSKDKVKV